MDNAFRESTISYQTLKMHVAGIIMKFAHMADARMGIIYFILTLDFTN